MSKRANHKLLHESMKVQSCAFCKTSKVTVWGKEFCDECFIIGFEHTIVHPHTGYEHRCSGMFLTPYEQSSI